MAFEVNAITTMAEIPALVQDFAENELGWTVTSGRITIPGSSNPVDVDIVGGGTTFVRLRLRMTDLSGTLDASCEQPRLKGTTASPTMPAPTNLYLYGGTEDSAPFLAGIIEFGFNRYRHFYMGSMIKYGNYTGGEIIQAGFHNSKSNGGSAESLAFSKYPFGARTEVSINYSGFANIVHADAGAAVKSIHRTSFVGDMDGSIQGDRVLGGYTDRVNSVYTDRAEQHFANASVLGPINLYATKSGLDRYYPIGRPPGVRMVNMENIEPGVLVNVAGTDWRVFPVFRRSFLTSITPVSGGWNAEETSHRRGLAYPEVA